MAGQIGLVRGQLLPGQSGPSSLSSAYIVNPNNGLPCIEVKVSECACFKLRPVLTNGLLYKQRKLVQFLKYTIFAASDHVIVILPEDYAVPCALDVANIGFEHFG
jgi:hypothetical protein